MKLSPLLLLGSAVLGGESSYSTPAASSRASLFESFDSVDALDTWSFSNNEKYSGGKWSIEPLAKEPLEGDNGLVLKNKAAHHAIVKELEKPFAFTKPLVVQYEVAFQSGIECGGAYMKLLSESDDDVADFHDRTPFSIMFGPDKCGANYKLHFIFRYKNPKTGEITERSPTKQPENNGKRLQGANKFCYI